MYTDRFGHEYQTASELLDAANWLGDDAACLEKMADKCKNDYSHHRLIAQNAKHSREYAAELHNAITNYINNLEDEK